MNTFAKLIPIGTCPSFGDGLIDTVNARDLHRTLRVKRDFTNWVKDRLESCMFKENEDFVVYAKSGENPCGGRPSSEYFLTLDAAKHFAMLERNDQGFKVRQYFVEFEKQAKKTLPALTFKELVANTLQANTETIQRLMLEVEDRDQKITVLAPKAAVFEEHCGRSMTINQFARTLEGVNLNMVRNDLKRLGYLYHNGLGLRVYAPYRDNYFVEKINPNDQGDRAMYVTPKGKELMTKLYREGKLTMKAVKEKKKKVTAPPAEVTYQMGYR